MNKLVIFINNAFWDFIFNHKFLRYLLIRGKYVVKEKKHNLKIFDVFYFQGHSFLDDEFESQGRRYLVENFSDLDLNPDVLMSLSQFLWLQNLRILNTQESLDRAIEMVESWMQSYSSFHHLYWRLDILSERVFNMLFCLDFLVTDVDEKLKNKIIESLNTQVNYLIYAYKKYKYQDQIKVLKAVIFFAIFANEKKLLSKTIDMLHKDIKRNILNDGGHCSRNVSLALNYLEDLLIIFYSLKESKHTEIKFIRETIDKIAVFIRSIRGLDGSLAIFNGSYPANSERIDYVLSLCNNSAAPSVILRDSGYFKIRTSNVDAIFDIGKQQAKYNSLLSFELGIKESKIITNLPNACLGERKNLFANNFLGRISHSCLVLFLENEPLFFDFNEKNLKQERRTEEHWEVVKFIYSYDQDIKFTYHKTMYFSRNSNIFYVLGEDLITFISGKSKIRKAFLKFHLSPNVKRIQFFNKKSLVSFGIKDNDFAFVTNDNPVKVSKSHFMINAEEVETCYTMEIPFSLDQELVKNEWSIQQK